MMIKKGVLIKGFTLVELVVTVILIAILAATSANVMIDRTAFDRRTAHDQAIALVRTARMYSFTSNCSVGVNLQEKRLYLTMQNVCGGSNDPIEERCDDDECVSVFANNGVVPFVHSITIPESLTITSDHLPFYFSPYGQALDPETNLIVNPEIVIGGRTISIVGQTGFIHDH